MITPVVAIASGKGGTGKTTVSVNMAVVSKEPLTLLDCDVEAPNVHLFLKPEWSGMETVTVQVPTVDGEKCTGCGRCREACRFNAVALLTGVPTFFQELCHSCGNCVLSCPENALSEVTRDVGTLRRGKVGSVHFADGTSNVGEARSTPVIDRVRAEESEGILTIVDAPPGTSCPAVAAVRGASYVVLVTEPTPFGLHDLRLAVEMVRGQGIGAGVLINRDGSGTDDVQRYCHDSGLPILARIPFDREVARAYAIGDLLVTAVPRLRGLFEDLLLKVREECGK